MNATSAESRALDLAGMLRLWARERPTQPALVSPAGGRRAGGGWDVITFGELDALVDRYAVGLARAGVRPGDRTIFLVPPSPHALAALYALMRVGAVPIAIDPGMGLAAMLRCVEHVRPRVVLAVPAFHLLCQLVRRPVRSARLFVTSGAYRLGATVTLAGCRAPLGDPFDGGAARADDVGSIVFTSGSTGPAKPVTVTHGMIAHRVRALRGIFGWREGGKVLVCFPSQAPTVLANGLTAILPRMDFARPARARPDDLADAIGAHAIEAVLASPIIWMRLVRHCERRGVRMPTLRQAVTAGAPIPFDLHHRLLGVIHPEGSLLTPYGSTEALPVTNIDSRGLTETWPRTRQGYGVCVGTAVPGVGVDVIRISDRPIARWTDDLRVPLGDVGELVVSGPVVSPAYAELPAADAEAKIRRGDETLHRMGDLGRVDEAGRVWFCGRKSHRIAAGGRVLLPALGESILDEHARVFRSAIVRAGPPGDETLVACVEMEAGETLTPDVARELEAMTRGTSWDSAIERYLQHPRLPVDSRHNSKVQRDVVERWAARRRARGVAARGAATSR